MDDDASYDDIFGSNFKSYDQDAVYPRASPTISAEKNEVKTNGSKAPPKWEIVHQKAVPAGEKKNCNANDESQTKCE